MVALGIHQDGLAQTSPDRSKETAQDVQPLLPLEFTQVHVEVDLSRIVETEDREHRATGPHPQLRTLCVAKTRQHGPCPGQRYHGATFAVPVPLPTLDDQVKESLPVVHRGVGDPQVRQGAHGVGVEQVLHVVPEQTGHPTRMTP